MTNEEANYYLKSSGFSDEQIETIARAYENSSYNSVKTELDCISRQALKDLGAECIAKRDENGNIIPLGCIDNLPSVSTEKTGRWIEEDMFDGDVAYRCSECNELFWIESGTPKDNEYNFCPKCGAKMGVEE